ncbi:hypothetical protein H0I76_05125 [Limibaculum sp. M0105]|uniref:Oxidoreductase molybdopterin-binding domain-containing protein n=1 Tax=Thermohalobaculum xanthum TaxID=2753746 RepID=A0A8J7M5G6_9RHOB|nr:hypothetical protein [Thermohalobaculum xanthum]MBK0398560.1 hypothetical protein [Thermohalobaculum xanthum]
MAQWGRGRLTIVIAAALSVTVALLSGPRALASGILVRDLLATPPIETQLSMEQLEALEPHVIATRTEFTDGEVRFEGPLVTDLLRFVGDRAWSSAKITAANDYAIDIPVSDFKAYGVILARRMNGRELSRRDKGPFWLMYPLDDFKELQDPVYNNRLIWQVVKIELK